MKTIKQYLKEGFADNYNVGNSNVIIVKDKEHLKCIVSDAMSEHGNNCNLNHLDISRLTDLSWFFNIGKMKDFNGDISGWDVSNIRKMNHMFDRSNFNGDISGWDVSKVELIYGMFRDSQFNGDISKWDVSKVRGMGEMFKGSKFNGNISKWDVRNVTNMNNMFDNCKIKKLPEWYKG